MDSFKWRYFAGIFRAEWAKLNSSFPGSTTNAVCRIVG
jgi:hypothetical protein